MVDKIVITGMGTVNPLGKSVEESWNNTLEGRSGIAPITLFDASQGSVGIAGEVKDFQALDYMPAKEARRRDRYQQLASAAALEAIEHSGLEVEEGREGRVGVIVSSAIGGLQSISDNIKIMNDKGVRKVSPFIIPQLMGDGAAGLIAIDNNFQGPSFSVTSACASGADGIGIAKMLIESGVIDAAVAGGCEATVTMVGIAAFDRLGALSRREEYPPNTPQPFDKNRDGLVVGEGAAALVLERESHAKSRGAVILAELAGYGSTADAYHITAPSENGIGGAKAIKIALDDAQLNIEEVGYISAHGTATQLNDVSETRAIKAAFGEQAYKIPVSSTKSMTGHMMGATGALEVIFCVQAMRDGVLPATINYETPDPECDLDYIPNTAREVKITSAVSNAFGFGGHNAVLVVKEYS
ncbi:MAG: beta-ketoacyl-ACP synthase II [Anaerolineales bacterium]|nr:beta-ketoacyl-ACP synthase II [Anaerolineales bacterium]